jgi:molybdate/tungstate transport system substrate-binding protein
LRALFEGAASEDKNNSLMRRSITAIILIALSACSSTAMRPVDVLYAGSLVTPVQGPVAQALAQRGIKFEGEPLGSKEIANLIIAGLRKPDVVVLVDRSVEKRLERQGLVARSWVLGSTSLGIGWSDKSRFASTLSQCPAGATAQRVTACLVKILSTPGVRLARTDPRLDPKGQYTIEAAHMFLGAHERAILGPDDNPAQIFPEESLLVHVESGDSGAGFVYAIEARSRHLHYVPLPGRASLSDKIIYTIAIMKKAPHPSTAQTLVDFLRNGAGKSILEDAGLSPTR